MNGHGLAILHLVLLLCCFTTTQLLGEEILLWPDKPGAEPTPHQDAQGNNIERIVVREHPSLVVMLPDEQRRSGAGVVICPGGGYALLAFEKEALEIGQWLNQQGIAAFCLKYRCGGEPNGHPVPVEDGLRAMRLVASRAEQWGVDANRIGAMGFSAGGHLAASISTLSDDGDPNAADPIDRLRSRPAFSLLVYPVISMQQQLTHAGSRRNLLGEHPTEELVQQLTLNRRVDEQTPPTFLIHASDDKSVKVAHSLDYYQALVAHKVPAEMHIFAVGGHGFGMRPQGQPVDAWPSLAEAWLASQGLTK